MGVLLDYSTIRIYSMLGAALSAIGVALSAFAFNVEYLIFSHSLLVSVGYALTFGPGFVLMSRNFKKKRGLAFAVSNAGISAGGMVTPLIISALLESFSLKTSLLIFGGIMSLVILCAALYRDPGPQPFQEHDSPIPSDKSSDESLILDFHGPRTSEVSENDVTLIHSESAHLPNSQTIHGTCNKEPSSFLLNETLSKDLYDKLTPETKELMEPDLQTSVNYSPIEHIYPPKKTKRLNHCKSSIYFSEMSLSDLEKTPLNSQPRPRCCSTSVYQNSSQAESDNLNNSKLSSLQNSELSNRLENSKLSNQLEKSKISNCLESSKLSNHLENSKLSNHLENSNLSNRLQNSNLSSHLGNSRLKNHLENSKLSSHLENSRLSVEHGNSRSSDRLQHGNSHLSVLKLSGSSAFIYASSPCLRMDTDTSSYSSESPEINVETFAQKLKNLLDLNLFKNPFFWFIAGFTAFGRSGLVLAETYIPPLAKESGLSEHECSLLLSVIGGLDIVFRIIPGIVIEFGFIKAQHMVIFTMLILGIVFQAVSYFDNFVSLMALSCLYGVLAGSYFTLLAVILIDLMEIANFGKIIGFTQIFHGASSFILFPVIGGLKDLTGTYNTCFQFLGACLIIGAIILLLEPLVRRRVEKLNNSRTLSHNDNVVQS